jgi:hypothetical protein
MILYDTLSPSTLKIIERRWGATLTSVHVNKSLFTKERIVLGIQTPTKVEADIYKDVVPGVGGGGGGGTTYIRVYRYVPRGWVDFFGFLVFG